jgi:hypothetical protein
MSALACVHNHCTFVYASILTNYEVIYTQQGPVHRQ